MPKKTCDLTKKKFPNLIIEINNSDAATLQIPADADCIFLFNPFDDFIMKKVVANIFNKPGKKSTNPAYYLC